MPVERFSSRRGRLDTSFLLRRLDGAKSYDRIAGYFSSSILEIAGEALERVAGPIRVVCNSDLKPEDVATARAADAAQRRSWCASSPETLVDRSGEPAKLRFRRLYDFLRSGKLTVRVLPDEYFGLIHGKAGVIVAANGHKTSFLGSVNESRMGWQTNYELMWEDDSPEAVEWVQEEFDSLWGSPHAVPLAEFVLEDIDRLSDRVLVPLDEWRKMQPGEDSPAGSALVETPVFRAQAGLWEHQKHFVELAFEAHSSVGGARFVLADQVGLGKTIQLAMVANLIALTGELPIVILAPKTLLWQWQAELRELLNMPSAVWDGRQWHDEGGIDYPATGPEGIRKCPRKVGIVSSGLITAKSAASEVLLGMKFDCVILDEAHRARRKNLGPGCDEEKAEPNNLLRFVQDISNRTKSLLLATATPVQIHPVEAWDLLEALNRGSKETVLGNAWSRWQQPKVCLESIMGRRTLSTDESEIWDWTRNPMPPKEEHADFGILRRLLDADDSFPVIAQSAFQKLDAAGKAKLRRLYPRLMKDHNPFIRQIVRRTRSFLETQRDPITGEPFLKPIAVVLHGEKDSDALRLPIYLQKAYEVAEEFTQLLGKRLKSAGFLRTLLMRRVGSTIHAGQLTVDSMLRSWQDTDEDEEEDDDDGDREPPSKTLTSDERDLLEKFAAALKANTERDPKYAAVTDYLIRKRWLERGCIVFSQYLDSIRWLGEQLSRELPDETFGIYSGAQTSGLMHAGEFRRTTREELKRLVARSEIRLLLGTDAASEGLNLQKLGTLINLDLPWNPTRLEQRKGRIQRIGQIHETVEVLNLRYRGSVEDRVHSLLSNRLQDIHAMFGQIPDVLEDVWIAVAEGELDRAKDRIAQIPKTHPFEIRYRDVKRCDWERCSKVLGEASKLPILRRGW